MGIWYTCFLQWSNHILFVSSKPLICNRSSALCRPHIVWMISKTSLTAYRLVIVAAARANQLSKNEPHGFGASLRSDKSTVKALEEVLAGKLSYAAVGEDEESFLDDEE